MTHEDHHKHQHHHHQTGKGRGVHKDWRLWAVVVLMLAAMVMYVLSMDESVQPGSDVPGPEVPAAP